MPIDVDPVDDGNLAEIEPGVVVYVTPQPSLLDAPVRYISHFATCPNADEWRRRNGQVPGR